MGGGKDLPPGEAPELVRARREQERQRRRGSREPLRILISSDPNRPVRTIVIPRWVPRTVTVGAGVLLLFAFVASLASVFLGSTVGRLESRLQAMFDTAHAMARRPFGAVAAHAQIVPDGGLLRKPVGPAGRFTLQLVNTGEKVDVVLDLSSGEVEAQSYRQLRRAMRCQRTGAETPIDPRLLEVLYRIATRTKQTIHLVSGFRAPMFSAADLSYHTRGMAADIRIPGMTPLMLRDLAYSMGIKGVGYYPVSQFVHVDVRDERFYWTDLGSDRSDGVGQEHGARD